MTDNRRVITVTEPQVWVLIGVFAAGLLGMLTLLSTMFVKLVQSGFDSLRSELRSEITGLSETMNRRFDYLDRDVQALTRRVFGDPDQ
ncbi:hypothetical protein [Ruicaihuangia caeni]|uniref:Hemagglutinin n=1 Tax=Ruicaihuangia caeni TaxID=3042517 RepID=A0AAW6T8I9_9MICO|nr:hypothetical protein [Klugiella sp. YN-L-19]MDI2099421.1 hypothetical protein [Klugiella sp. YN-L-19]